MESSPSSVSVALALPLPGRRAAISSWWWRKQYYTTGWLLRAINNHAAWMASSNALVKNSDAASNSSSEKGLSLADIILIDWSRMSVVDTDADRGLDSGPRVWEDVDENGVVWDLMGEVTMERVGAKTVGAVTLRLLCITLTMWMRVELREWEMTTGFRSLVFLLNACLELGDCMPLIDLVLCLRFRLLVSLPVVIEWAKSREQSYHVIEWG